MVVTVEAVEMARAMVGAVMVVDAWVAMAASRAEMTAEEALVEGGGQEMEAAERAEEKQAAAKEEGATGMLVERLVGKEGTAVQSMIPTRPRSSWRHIHFGSWRLLGCNPRSAPCSPPL